VELETFLDIMKNDDLGGEKLRDLNDCNAVVGLAIMRKYIPKLGILTAAYEVIYSVSPEDLVKAGITVEDAVYLREINWMVSEYRMACFV